MNDSSYIKHEINWKDVLYWDELYFDQLNTSILKSLGRLIYYSFTVTVIDHVEKSKVFFIAMGESYRRKDRIRWLNDIFKLSGDHSVIKCRNRKIAFSFSRLLEILTVYKSIKREYGFRKRLFFISKISRYISEFVAARKAIDDNERLKLLVAFCDAHPIDYILINYVKNHKERCRTATLQHGILWEKGHYYLSHSDFFLGWGDFFKIQAIQNGIGEDAYLTLGMPQLINKKVDYKIRSNKLRNIAVVFSGIANIKEDEMCLKVVHQYAKANGYKIFVRLHPSAKIEQYSIFNSIDVSISTCGLQELLSEVAFGVVTQTSAFIDFLIDMVPCVIFEIEKTFFSGIDWYSFHDEESLAQFDKALNDTPEVVEKKMITARANFTETDEVEGRYKNFFDTVTKSL